MLITIAEHAGECFGVSSALARAQEILNMPHREHLYSYGALIHNPRIVKHYADMGLLPITEADFGKLSAHDYVLIRSHGAPQHILHMIRRSGATIVDATCPHVARVQRAAQDLLNEGYNVAVVGDASHPEVAGIVGSAPGARVISSKEDIDDSFNGVRVGLVSQTTQPQQVFDALCDALSQRTHTLKVVNTICPATSLCQKDIAELSLKSDAIVIIGGKNSANTKHLVEIASQSTKTYHIEDASELESSWFAPHMKVGIGAGTSTPHEHIVVVKARLMSFDTAFHKGIKAKGGA